MRRRLSVVFALLVVTPALAAADAPPDAAAQRKDRAEHIFTDAIDHWVEDIAGFNRRTTSCDLEAASKTHAFDVAHHATFKRTLGWRWDAATATWSPTPAEGAEVLLAYLGPVRSGTETLGGRTRSFCEAEAPDTITLSIITHDESGSENADIFTHHLPALASGFGDVVRPGDARGHTGVATPRSDVALRAAKARTVQEETGAKIGEIVAADRHLRSCDEAQAKSALRTIPKGLERSRSRTYGARYDKAGARWVAASDRDEDVRNVIKGPAYFGAIEDGDHTSFVCDAMQPDSIATTFFWQDEGANEITFTDPVSVPPAQTK